MQDFDLSRRRDEEPVRVKLRLTRRTAPESFGSGDSRAIVKSHVRHRRVVVTS